MPARGPWRPSRGRSFPAPMLSPPWRQRPPGRPGRALPLQPATGPAQLSPMAKCKRWIAGPLAVVVGACDGEEGQGAGRVEGGCGSLTSEATGLLPADYADPGDIGFVRRLGVAAASCYFGRMVTSARASECLCAGPPVESAAAFAECASGEQGDPVAVECVGVWAAASCADLYGPQGLPPPCGLNPRAR